MVAPASTSRPRVKFLFAKSWPISEFLRKKYIFLSFRKNMQLIHQYSFPLDQFHVNNFLKAFPERFALKNFFCRCSYRSLHNRSKHSFPTNFEIGTCCFKIFYKISIPGNCHFCRSTIQNKRIVNEFIMITKTKNSPLLLTWPKRAAIIKSSYWYERPAHLKTLHTDSRTQQILIFREMNAKIAKLIEILFLTKK